jgi:hypothetical protein
MCFVVIDKEGDEVLRTKDWHEADKVMRECEGRIHTEGCFDDGRLK